MDNYWDSFDCEVQCEEVYTEDPDILHNILENEEETPYDTYRKQRTSQKRTM